MLWRISGGAFVLTGALELLFLGLSVMGTLLGGVMSDASLTGELRQYEALIGPVVLLFYGVWLFCTLLAAPIHLAAGVLMLAGRGPRGLVWAAVGVSILPLFTVYCAPTSLVAGILGLVVMIQSGDRDRLT